MSVRFPIKDRRLRVRMHVLFIHRAFPGQFRYIAPLLVQRYGWQSTFLTADQRIPSPGEVRKLIYQLPDDVCAEHPVAAGVTGSIGHALGVYQALRDRSDIKPDLVVSHGSYGSSLFLPYLYDCPILNFFEYFYRPVGQDLGYRPEQLVTELQLLRCRADNAMSLLDLENCDAAWCPTRQQLGLMPAPYRDKA